VPRASNGRPAVVDRVFDITVVVEPDRRQFADEGRAQFGLSTAHQEFDFSTIGGLDESLIRIMVFRPCDPVRHGLLSGADEPRALPVGVGSVVQGCRALLGLPVNERPGRPFEYRCFHRSAADRAVLGTVGAHEHLGAARTRGMAGVIADCGHEEVSAGRQLRR
jgi:hypothetical protein